jgi:alkylation response protein AidB-like acyl-CoA dehydrogenase
MYVGLNLDPGWSALTATGIGEFAEHNRDELNDSRRLGHFPRDLYVEMGKRGWIGPVTPVEEGGLGGGIAEYCVIEEEVGRHGIVSPQISVQGQCWLLKWGDSVQRARYLPGIARGEIVFSESISEPEVGSSLKLMRTTAVRDGADWIIRGAKTHVNLGHQSDVTVVYAMADEGITSFLVDMDEPGISTRQTDPIGLRMIPTADVRFDDVRVPSRALLGPAGEGMKTFLSTFNTSRLGNASELIGFARRALVNALDYASQRRVDQTIVTEFQGNQWTVADCFSELYGAAMVRDRGAVLADTGVEHSLETTLAKKLAIDAAEHTINAVFGLVGGYGLYRGTDFGQLLHDMKVLRVAGGSLEILRNYVARQVLRDANYRGLR